MQIQKRKTKHNDAFLHWSDLSQILHFSPPVPIAAPPIQPDTAEPSSPQSTPSARQLTPNARKEKRTIAVSDTLDSHISSVRSRKRKLKKQKKTSKSPWVGENIQNTE